MTNAGLVGSHKIKPV
uniref:Uncharacterized protein n=1 Tax=Anguilla anguilla TaxID=7936 RepID=A0A0E9UGW6_ANGAN